ncbi:hypothetical protein [Streptomyces sp. NPDC058092]|uniref:hypothetical protein n=1 Tax=Streptomyces sp. NPDC058092 TaxID=3346336 RepID=UPI0036EF7D72
MANPARRPLQPDRKRESHPTKERIVSPKVLDTPTEENESAVKPAGRSLRIELLSTEEETHLVKGCGCGCGIACACLPCEVSPSEPDTTG